VWGDQAALQHGIWQAGERVIVWGQPRACPERSRRRGCPHMTSFKLLNLNIAPTKQIVERSG
jgi:hypothetical protein